MRCFGGGRPRKAIWLRIALYEWWSGTCFVVDGNAVRKGCPAIAGHRKKLARFTQAMLNEKAKELIATYCTQKLRRGQRCEIPQLRADWHSWRKSYGLSMRYPNRKFKVPLLVLRERLERSWLNVYLVRAACHALLGYDMEIENWDQSPFHHNETGSQNSKTLAIAGVNVPLVEGHDATRSRRTANFTCFSDKARLTRGGPPYMECMFRVEGGGERVKPQLEEHIRGRGYRK